MAEESPRVFGAYLLLKSLGSGAMGDVWLARPLNPGRGIPTPVVIKRLHGELAARKGFVARFRHEAEMAVHVDSVHVAKVYDVGAVGETLYIAMEHVSGWPLSLVLEAIIESGRHASIASVIDLIAGGLEGLDKLHTARDQKSGKPLGIVHRDISPKNLMVGEDGKMRLIDLGLGKSNAQDWKTRTGVVMGSVGYMPPEQARGERVDARADIYSMAVVCFEMLALRNYIKRGTLSSMMESSAQPVFMRPSDFRPDVPKGLDAVLEKALSPDRERRHQTARELLGALRQVVPPARSEGGMAMLLNELFGATKRAREEEIGRLLALPVPDASDAEPTKIFVMRPGVLGPSVLPTVATEVHQERRYEPNQPTSTLPPAQVYSMSSYQMVSPRRAVSIPVLMAAVFAAALTGGLVAVLFVRHALPPPQIVTELPVQPADPAPAPVPEPTAEPPERPEAPEQPEQPERLERAEVAPPAERTPPPARKKRPPARPAKEPEAAAPAVSHDSLNAELERLRQTAIALRSGTDDPAARDELSKYLAQLSWWMQSSNLEGKQKAIAELRARLTRRDSPSLQP